MYLLIRLSLVRWISRLIVIIVLLVFGLFSMISIWGCVLEVDLVVVMVDL